MKDYKPHQFSLLFEQMPTNEISDLMKSIKAEGLHQPIVLFEGKILDGRHRYEACGLADVEPRFVEYTGTDPIAFVIASNMTRRHMTVGERAAVATKLGALRHGGDRKSTSKNQVGSSPLSVTKQADSAAIRGKAVNVSADSVRASDKIQKASPKLFDRLAAGEITIHAAEKKLEEAKSKTAAKAEVLDETGYPIPSKLHEFWNRRHEIQELMTAVSKVKTRIEKGREEDDVLFRPINQASIDQLERTYSFLSDAKPHAVCLSCQGLANDSCRVCKGTGLVSKFGYETRADKDVRAIREKALARSRA